MGKIKPVETAIDKKAVVEILNRILELELAGVVRYTHYSLMVFGHGRIPIVAWLRQQANEGLMHAVEAGEQITALGGHPSLEIGKLLETHRHDIDQILREAMEHERESIHAYRELSTAVQGKSVLLEEYARRLLYDEELHLTSLDKMLRRPGKLDRSS